MNKSELRNLFLQKRKALTPAEVKRRSERIAERFFDYLTESDFIQKPITIHTFLPIQAQNEVDTWPIIRLLWAQYSFINVAVPVTNVVQHTLHHYHLTPQTSLAKNRWGIPEPVITHQSPLSPTDFDLILVPLLAFDRQGQRIGYGGGYYDRFLAECRADCLTVGLSFFEPIERIEGVESTDVPLSTFLTADQVYSF